MTQFLFFFARVQATHTKIIMDLTVLRPGYGFNTTPSTSTNLFP